LWPWCVRAAVGPVQPPLPAAYARFVRDVGRTTTRAGRCGRTCPPGSGQPGMKQHRATQREATWRHVASRTGASQRGGGRGEAVVRPGRSRHERTRQRRACPCDPAPRAQLDTSRERVRTWPFVPGPIRSDSGRAPGVPAAQRRRSLFEKAKPCVGLMPTFARTAPAREATGRFGQLGAMAFAHNRRLTACRGGSLLRWTAFRTRFRQGGGVS
jgi:hypothetical protein